MRLILLLFICLLTVLSCAGSSMPWTHILQKIANDQQLTKFHALIEGNRIAKPALIYRELTIFAPTNEAFAAYDGVIDEELVLYHIVPIAKTLDNFGDMNLVPLLEEHPYLWINTKSDELYVNNAKILKNQSDFTTRTRSDVYGKLQVLHVIDQVLTPMCVTKTSPTIYDFLAQPKLWNFQTYSFNAFYRRIYAFRMTNVYKNHIKGTFFITPDQYMSRNIESQIDKDILKSNLVSNRVIFTRTVLDNFTYITLNVERDYYVTIEFIESDVLRISKISKASKQRINEKLAKIIHSDIPMRNGVVHIVRQLIGVFERKLTKFPFLSVTNKLETDLQLNITHRLMEVNGLLPLLQENNVNFTLFLPTDRAWRRVATSHGLNETFFDSPQFQSVAGHVMRRHIICDDYYNTQRLLDLTYHINGGEIRLDVGNEVLLVKIQKYDRDIFILWGVNKIRITRADYECTNGIIHLIDTPFIHNSEMRATETNIFSNLMHYIKSVTLDVA